MARGNQREISREKNLKKLEQQRKSQAKGGDPQSRNLNDKAALAAKIEAKKALQEKQALEDAHREGRPKPTPKAKKKELDPLDLLNAGLSGVKKA